MTPTDPTREVTITESEAAPQLLSLFDRAFAAVWQRAGFQAQLSKPVDARSPARVVAPLDDRETDR